MIGVQWLAHYATEQAHLTLPDGWPSFTYHAAIMLLWSVALIGWTLHKDKPLWALGISVRQVPGDIAWGLAACVAMGAFYLLAGGAVRLYFELFDEAPAQAFRDFLYSSAYGDVSLAHILGVVLFYPVFEELWFRGVLYAGLRSEQGRLPAIILSAIFFALAHSNTIPVNQFFGGLVFAIAYEYRRTLVAPIILHIAGNGALVVLGRMLPAMGIE